MIQFTQPLWFLVIALPAVGLAVIIGRKTLSGMATWARRVALLVRIIVILLLVAAIADPQWAKTAKNVALNVVLDVSRSTPAGLQSDLENYLAKASSRTDQLD